MKLRLVVLVVGVVSGCGGGVDPCAGVATCGTGRCVIDDGKAACLCEAGFKAQGLTCVAADPCASNPCAGSGRTCVATAGLPVCGCEAGFVAEGSTCVRSGPCNPNPCQGLHQTVCVVEGASSRCACDPGYAPELTGCSAMPVFDCSRQHTDGDAFEPDECPMLAKPLVFGLIPQQHTIAPVADEDWVRFNTLRGHVLKVTVSASSFPMYIDAFKSDGVTPIAAERRGIVNPVFSFLAVDNGLVLLRFKPLRANDMGTYFVHVEDVDVDDFPNEAALAPQISAGASFDGMVQYGGDVDLVTVEVAQGRAYEIALGTTSSPAVVVDVLGLDGMQSIFRLDRASAALSKVVVRPAEDGRYTLRARALISTGTGAFRVTFTDVGADDHADNPAEATEAMPNPMTTAAAFERATDLDVFGFAVTAGNFYTFTCQPDYQSGYLSCRVAVRGQTGNLLGEDSDYSTSSVTFKAPATGRVTATLSLAQATPNMTLPATYRWRLESLGPDDHGDTTATATPATLGAPMPGRIESPTDRDYYSFTAQIGHIYVATCTGMSSSDVRFYDASGGLLTMSSSSSASIVARSAGTFFVSVQSYSSFSFGTYSLRIEDSGLDDHGDTSALATALTTGTATAGSIQYVGDRDVFSFMVTSPRIYEVRCASSQYGVCGLTVRDAAGQIVASSQSGSTVVASFKSATSGRFIVEVGASFSSDLGAYSLTANDVGLDDHADTAVSATPITVAAPLASATIQYFGDRDVFSFATVSGNVYRFTCTPSSTAFYGCAMVVRDASGVTVFSTGGSSGVAAFVATSTGPYSVEVSGSSSSSGGIGGYTYRVVDDGPDDHGETPASATPITEGVQASGSIQFSNDRDVFSFAGSVGRIYRFTCMGTGCALTARNPSGVTVASAYGSSMTQLSFKAATSGTFSVEVSSSSSLGAYTVTLSQLTDDHVDSAPGATPLTLGMTASGNIEYVGDLDWFDVSLTAGTLYQVTTGGLTMRVTVLDPTGTTQLAGPTYSSVSFTPSTTGRYYVRVQSYFSTDVGAYTVRVN